MQQPSILNFNRGRFPNPLLVVFYTIIVAMVALVLFSCTQANGQSPRKSVTISKSLRWQSSCVDFRIKRATFQILYDSSQPKTNGNKFDPAFLALLELGPRGQRYKDKLIFFRRKSVVNVTKVIDRKND